MRFADTIVPRRPDWSALRAEFRWPETPVFNIATACCDRWARQDPGRLALVVPDPERRVTFGEMGALANRFANVLAAQGFKNGDRLAILLPQSVEVMVCHFGILKNAGVALPLFTLFGEDALEFRLADSGAKGIVTDRANLPKVAAIADRLPDLRHIWCVDGAEGLARDFAADLARAKDSFRTLPTRPSDPALLVYTSGTTGPPKGALHGHRVLIGHLPCTETSHDFFPQTGDLGWTPADWAWMGGLMNIAMPCLYYGVPVVAHRMGKFDPEAAHHLIACQRVRNAFLPPTALKLMRQVPAPQSSPLRSVASGGEALGADTFEWAREALGLTINEIYGQTECNLVLGNSAGVFAPRAGSMGRENPGAEVTVLDAQGHPVAAGVEGEIAIHRDHGGMFLGYWRNDEKTAAKFAGPWMRTGDVGLRDEAGYFWFSSRDDDVISSGGYRIGPTEIETCLTGHEAVVMAAVVGVPDPLRGQVVKAFVVLASGVSREGLSHTLIELVKARVSPHVAPRRMEFVDSLPMTATGKIMRRDLRERG
ncbi:MAG: AMP-binding protein [Pseudomonadota bacterium]